MGYYNIYSILKDIIRTIFGRKFLKFTLFIIIASIVFLVLSDKGVFAVSFIASNNNEYTIPLDFPFDTSVYPYIYINVIEKTENGSTFNYFDVYYSSQPATWVGGAWGNIELQAHISGLCEYNFNNTNVWDTNYIYNSSHRMGTRGTVHFSNYDIKDSSGSVKIAGSDFLSPPISNPQFFNKDSFIDFSNDSLIIHPNDYGVEDTLYLHFLTVDSTVSDDVNTYYYYSESVFALNYNSKYYDILDDTRYYNIPRGVFGLQANKQYVFFLSENSDPVNNSVGLYDFSDDFDGFYLNPTSNQITPDDTIINNQQNQNNQLNDINNFLNDKNIDSSTNNDINNSLNKDVSTNSDAIVTSFFSTLTGMITDVTDYELSEDTTISLPIMNTDQSIILHSNYLYTYLNGAMKTIIYAFWYYLFGFYIFKFVNKIYISVKSGNILNGVSSSDEVITNDML